MSLRKDDPVYYKAKINKLIREAKENNLEAYAFRTFWGEIRLNFTSRETGESASVKINN